MSGEIIRLVAVARMSACVRVREENDTHVGRLPGKQPEKETIYVCLCVLRLSVDKNCNCYLDDKDEDDDELLVCKCLKAFAAAARLHHRRELER